MYENDDRRHSGKLQKYVFVWRRNNKWQTSLQKENTPLLTSALRSSTKVKNIKVESFIWKKKLFIALYFSNAINTFFQ